MVAVSTGWKLRNSSIWGFALIMLLQSHLPTKTTEKDDRLSRYFSWPQTQAQLGRTATSEPFRIKLTCKISLCALLYKAHFFRALTSGLVKYQDKPSAPAEIFIPPFNFHVRHKCCSWRLKIGVRIEVLSQISVVCQKEQTLSAAATLTIGLSQFSVE